MYKLLVVDDEEEVRQGLILKMEWHKYNCEVIGEAQNGMEALDMIEENVPDIIITDISMPLMNGLELSEHIQLNYPTVKTIILTGFDDFNYAQQAIKFGVEDYVLKPVLPKDIDDLMKKVKNKLDYEIEQKENIIKLKEHFNESLPIIREKFLSMLIEGYNDDNKVRSKIAFFSLNLVGDCFVVAATNIDNSNGDDKIFDNNDTELMRYAVMNIAKEITDKYHMGEALFHHGEMVFIFSINGNANQSCDKDTIYRKIYSILEEIRQNVEKYLKLTVTIGVGNVIKTLDRLKESYKSALSALEYKLVMGTSKIIFIEDLEPKKKEVIAFDELKESQLISAIKFGTENEINKVVEQLFNNLTGTQAAIKEYQLYFIEIVAAISKICRDFDIDTGEILGVKTNLYVEILEFNSFDKLKAWVSEICIKLMKFMSATRQNSTQLLLKKAKDYVLGNYGDETLSIQKVADYLYISSSYLSMIFKKETGDTFLKYLVRVRLNIAIELLKGPYKTAEIAERVGYPDISYFSYFFKKNYGISPREFRNNINKKESLT